MRKPVFRVSDPVGVQPQKMAREIELWIKEEEGLYYLCSENNGADQLCGYRAADLRLCFCICKKQVFSSCSLYYTLRKHAHALCRDS